MYLDTLPIEILHAIFNYVTVFDIQELYKVNRHIYFTIKDKQFGVKYLANQAHDLSALVKITTELTGLDRIAIGHKNSNCIIVVFSSPSKNNKELYEIKVCLTGKVHVYNTDSELECSSLAVPRTNHNYVSCPFCSFHGIQKYDKVVDKGFRIFFQTWRDEFHIKTKSGIEIVLVIKHEDIPPGWDIPQPLPEYEIFRYGVFVTLDMSCFLENLWQLREKSRNSSPTRTKIVQVYNPWG
jgi:hypothetical protein